MAETRLWLALGDSARARSWLDPVLNRSNWLDFLLEDPINAASLMQCLALRAELATPAETGLRTKWGSLVATLWSDAEPGPADVVKRLKVRTPP